MKISERGLNIIKEFEGFRANAYYDSVGVITIGYGTTNSDMAIIGFKITPDSKCTKEQASAWLSDSVNKKYAPAVEKYDSIYHWKQNEFDALVSFAYNIGSIDQLTAKGTRSKEIIAAKILEYNKAGGKVVKGLQNRREKERALFLSAEVTVTYYSELTLLPALAAVGAGTSYENRKKIAEANGITGYTGTAEQNIRMLDLIKEGKLKRV